MNHRIFTIFFVASALLVAAGQAQSARKSIRHKSAHSHSKGGSGGTSAPSQQSQGGQPAAPAAAQSQPRQDPQKSQQAVKQQGPLAYKDIFPLLKEKCGKCHGSDPDGDLVLLTYKDLMAGGEHGAVVTPGQPEKSNLYLKLTDTPPFGKKMPKKGGPLTQEEIELLKKWVADGAKE